MQTLKFETIINATAEKVWWALWDDKNYGKWTLPFCAGCYAESDWEEGNSIKFLGLSGDGMYSIIERKIEIKLMTFKHLGSIKNGEEIHETEWANSIEDYILEEKNGNTILKVSVDILESYEYMFNKSFDAGLKTVKEISEK